MSLFGVAQRYWMEWRAKGKSYAELARSLQAEGEVVTRRFQNGRDRAANRRTASHIVGIERWGQRRLRTLLGEPLVMDEYDGYRPGPDCTLRELACEFPHTRKETLALLRSLEDRNIPLTQTVPHNESGPMSVGAWFVYFQNHAGRESRFVR
ncbi:MAG: hypothetical protein DCC57_23390 [Chloroflexi bacterium]|nr:MAG: hypothetical protein DCC57_23390 [Chloroflexota bacterium]